MGFIFNVKEDIKNKRDESPLFSLKVGNLNALQEKAINLDTKPYSKYIPYNYLYIANRSQSDIKLIINDELQKIISKGTIESFDYSVIQAIRTLRIKNIDAANIINDGEIEILIQKQKIRLADVRV